MGVVNPNGTVLRYGYATGSGTNTIGINPTQRKIHEWLPAFDNLYEMAKEVIPEKYHNLVVTGASIKAFERYKNPLTKTNGWEDVICGTHADVQKNEDNTPKDNQSQKPDTPVILFTFGGKKQLSFKKVPAGTEQHELNGLPIYRSLHQTNCRILVLDNLDEDYKLDDDGELFRYFHTTKFEMLPGNKNNTLIFTIMLRCVQNEVLVNVEDGSLVDTSGPENQRLAFEQAAVEWAEGEKLEWHQARINEFLGKLEKIINKLPK